MELSSVWQNVYVRNTQWNSTVSNTLTVRIWTIIKYCRYHSQTHTQQVKLSGRQTVSSLSNFIIVLRSRSPNHNFSLFILFFFVPPPPFNTFINHHWKSIGVHLGDPYWLWSIDWHSNGIFILSNIDHRKRGKEREEVVSLPKEKPSQIFIWKRRNWLFQINLAEKVF